MFDKFCKMRVPNIRVRVFSSPFKYDGSPFNFDSFQKSFQFDAGMKEHEHVCSEHACSFVFAEHDRTQNTHFTKFIEHERTPITNLKKLSNTNEHRTRLLNSVDQSSRFVFSRSIFEFGPLYCVSVKVSGLG